eukprot:TRINITY_DN25169_c0_g1_i2.p1 TRINITY_DN25169_c0_g1~~TRINITY_DN25169_c0_g1_i2.p1  ORF type:complete len:307 (-),score=70.14 TRINITY_DN25169_c0_g1_i2:638-1558(-)
MDMDKPELATAPVSLDDEQPHSALTTLARQLKTLVESGVNLENQDEWKSARDVVWGLLDDVADEWEPQDIEILVDEGNAEKDLSYLCLVAMKFKHVGLYSMLTKCEITPRKLYGSGEETWEGFRQEIIAVNNPRILTASLRFFRTADDGVDSFERLWANDLDYLIIQAGLIAQHPVVEDSVRELGSITRIIWNCSSDESRPMNIKSLLLKVWESFLEMKNEELKKPEPNELGKTVKKRVEHCFYALLHCSREKVFGDKTIWSEHAVRNLLTETLCNGLEGQHNHTNPSKSFCREVSLEYELIGDTL